MRITTVEDVLKELGFEKAYGGEFKMKDSRGGTESIFCNQKSGIVIYLASLSNEVQHVRLYAEIKDDMRNPVYDECCYMEGKNVVHICQFVGISNSFKRNEIKLLLNSYLHKLDGITSKRWSIFPNMNFMDFRSPGDDQWDGDTSIITRAKIAEATDSLHRILGISQ